MKNVGNIDRLIRLISVGFIFYAYYMRWTVGWTAILSAVVAVVLLTTAFSGECPLYKQIGLNTK